MFGGILTGLGGIAIRVWGRACTWHSCQIRVSGLGPAIEQKLPAMEEGSEGDGSGCGSFGSYGG